MCINNTNFINKNQIIFKKIVFSFWVLASLSLNVYGQHNYYVAPNGSDRNDGITPDTPWKTLNYAVSRLLPGDTLEIMAGTYYELVNDFVNSGTKDSIITIRNYDNDRVIINGNGQWTVINFASKDYYHFEGLELTNAVWAGFNGTNYHHCRINNCKIHDIGPSSGTAVGIYVSAGGSTLEYSSYNIIENNIIHDCYGEGIYVGDDAHSAPPDGTPCNYNIIRNNTIYKCVDGIDVKTGSKYNKIIGNDIYDCNGGIYSGGIIVFEETLIDSNKIHNNINYGLFIQGKHNLITRNLIYDNKSYGILIDGYQSKWNNYKDSGDSNQVLNNTVVYNKNWGLYLWGGQNQDCTGNIIKNNIIAYNKDYQFYASLYDYPQADKEIPFNANNWFSQSGPIIHYNDTDYFDIESFKKTTGMGIKSLSVDPQFIDPVNKNFNLKASSPMIDSGIPVNLPFWGTAPDMGAIEYISLASSKQSSFMINDLYATISVGLPSPTGQKRIIPLVLITSKKVIKIPTPLILKESDASETYINLEGNIPGQNFSGNFVLDSSIAEGPAYFYLPDSSLIDTEGNISNVISEGDSIYIDKTPPASPTNIQLHVKTK